MDAPAAKRSPTVRLRERSPVQVRMRSPAPASPRKVSVRPPQMQTQTRHFGETTSHEGRTGVQTESQAIAYAGGNGHDVLGSPRDFDPDEIVVRVHTQAAAVEFARETNRKIRDVRREHDGRRQAERYFLRKARSGDDTDGPTRQNHARNLVGQQPGVLLEALAGKDEMRRRRRQPFEHFPQADHRDRADDRIAALEHGPIRIDAYCRRNRDGRKIPSVLPLAIEGRRLVGIARPEANVVLAVQADCKRSSPRARPGHAELHEPQSSEDLRKPCPASA
jgi:hypothetical protein